MLAQIEKGTFLDVNPKNALLNTLSGHGMAVVLPAITIKKRLSMMIHTGLDHLEIVFWKTSALNVQSVNSGIISQKTGKITAFVN